MKDRLGFFVYRGFTAVLGALPEPVMRQMGELLGRAAWHLAPGRRRLVQRHLLAVAAATERQGQRHNGGDPGDGT